MQPLGRELELRIDCPLGSEAVHSTSIGPSVLLVSEPVTQGVAICVADLAAAGVEAGWRVTVACPQGGVLSDKARDAGAQFVEVPIRKAPGPWDARSASAIRRLARGADVIHLHSSKAGAIGRIAMVGLSSPCIYSPHGWSFLMDSAARPMYLAAERSMAAMTDVIVAASEDEAAVGRSALGRWGKRIQVINNGVDINRFRPASHLELPTRIGARGPLIVCVGRLARQKGQDVAIRALAAMAHPTARLRLVGDGAIRPELTQLARVLGVADRVEYVGDSPRPEDHIREADIVVVPSRWDGMSLALLEAMACGAAVIASTVTGSSVVEGAGVLVAPDDPLPLARAADRLLGDPVERARLGNAARARAEVSFDVARTRSQTLDLCSNLAGIDIITLDKIGGERDHIRLAPTQTKRRRVSPGHSVDDETLFEGAGGRA